VERAKQKPAQSRVDAGLVEEDYEVPVREDRQLAYEESQDEDREIPTEVVTFAPSSVANPHVSEEEQDMEMTPAVFGPPAYGSPDPATSATTLMPLDQYPEDAPISDDYGVVPEATEGDEGAGEGEYNATKGAVELADTEGVDLGEVEGTGEDGRITKADVESYLDSQSQTA